MSIVSQSKVDAFIEQYKGATKAELRANLARLKGRLKTNSVQAEIKAIKALLR